MKRSEKEEMEMADGSDTFDLDAEQNVNMREDVSEFVSSTVCSFDAFALVSTPSPSPTTSPSDERVQSAPISASRPKNLIIMIGDGMGTVYNTAYRLYHAQQRTIDPRRTLQGPLLDALCKPQHNRLCGWRHRLFHRTEVAQWKQRRRRRGKPFGHLA